MANPRQILGFIICVLYLGFNEVRAGGSGPNPYFCDNRIAGLYADADNNCTAFYNCGPHQLRLPCIQTKIFDVATCSCRNRTELADNYACVASYRPCMPPQPTTRTVTTTAASTVTPAPESKPFTCVHRPDGLYPAVSNHCRSYHACLNEQTYNYTCPPPHRFDHRSCNCLPDQSVRCSPVQDDTEPCRPAPPRTTTQPPTAAPPSDFCRGRGFGYYADLQRGCEWFFVCQGGNFPTTQFQCPSHLRFDRDTCRCEYPYDVLCTVLDGEPCIPAELATTTTTIAPPPTTTPSLSPAQKFCQGRRAGFYVAPHLHCRYFYSCVDGTGKDRLYRCVTGYSFDERRGACKPKDQVPCTQDGDGDVQLDGSIEWVIKR